MPSKKTKEVYESKDHLFFRGSFTCVKCGTSLNAARDTECIVVREGDLKERVAA